MADLDIAVLDDILDRAHRFSRPDPRPFLTTVEHIFVEDNERGLDLGQDKDGIDLKPVTYRPKDDKPKKWSMVKQSELRRRSAHVGKFAESAYNNLTPAQYRRLGGKPLVPRGRGRSRLYTNFYTRQGFEDGYYYVSAGWAGIVSSKGVPFMDAHFNGESVGRGHKVELPVRDVRGLRPWGQAEVEKELDNWGELHVEETLYS